VKMRRPTRSAGGHRREGKATCHGCEHPTQTKRPRRPAAGTAASTGRRQRPPCRLSPTPAAPTETRRPSANTPQTPGSTSPTGCTAAENAAAGSACRQAGHRTLHHPPPTIPQQRPPISAPILRPATAPVRCDQLHAARGKRPVPCIALPGHLGHHPLRNLPRQHEIEQPLRQSGLMRPARTTLHRNGKSPGVHGNEDLDPLAPLRAPDPVASTTCRTERRIQKAFIQPILPSPSTG